MIPGEYQIQPGEIELNVGRRTLTLGVANIIMKSIEKKKKAKEAA